MIRIFFGVLIAALGTLAGFTIGGGRLSPLFHPAEVVVIGAILIGGLITAFGLVRPFGMLFDALVGRRHSLDRIQVNIKICESGSCLGILEGVAATLLGAFITLDGWDGDARFLALKFGAAISGTVIGLIIAATIFQPLKFYFHKQAIETASATTKESPYQPPVLSGLGVP